MDSPMTYGRVAMSTGAFSPLQIPGCKIWCRSDLDVVLGASGVAQWTDQSGFGNHLTQATAANQPTITQAAINGIQGLTFNGNNQYVQNTAFSMAQPCTYFAVTQYAGAGVTGHLWDGITARHELLVAAGANTVTSAAASSLVANLPAGIANANMALIATMNGATSILRVNGGIYGNAGSVGAGSLGGLLLGARVDFSAPSSWNGYIMEFAMFNSVLQQVYIDRLEDYARMRYSAW